MGTKSWKLAELGDSESEIARHSSSEAALREAKEHAAEGRGVGVYSRDEDDADAGWTLEHEVQPPAPSR